MTNLNPPETPSNVIPFEAHPDPGFNHWLAQSRSTLAVSTYQAGMLAFFSWNGAAVSVLLRRFEKVMGLDWDGTRLVLATRHALLVYANSRALAHRFREPGRYDALYLPRVSYPHPDLHIHDVAFGPDGIWMVNTRFNCLAHPSDQHTFEPVWRPRFITDLVPEDRCHLNGLAVSEGRPVYVSALAETNTAGGWREHKQAGGILIDYASGEIVVRGLAMPHSPRLHQGSLYVLNSGAGELLRVDPQRGSTDVVTKLDGYLRGLTLAGSYALVGLCQARETQIFGGMPVEIAHDRLKCGLAVIDLRSGQRVGLLEITSGCTELFDIRLLAGQLRPAIVHADTPDALEAISVPDCYYWLRPENLIKD